MSKRDNTTDLKRWKRNKLGEKVKDEKPDSVPLAPSTTFDPDAWKAWFSEWYFSNDDSIIHYEFLADDSAAGDDDDDDTGDNQ